MINAIQISKKHSNHKHQMNHSLDKIQSYDTYKPSNIEWIGEIPSHWNLYPLLHFADSEKYSFVDGPFGSDLKNEEYVDDGIPLIQLNNIGIGKHKLDTLKFITDEKSKQLFKHRIYSGDVVIAKMAEPVARATRVSNQYKMYVIVADCIRFKNDVNKIDSDYLIYSLNSDYLKTQAEFESTGTTRIRIGLNTAKKLRICYPPLQEQQAIVTYLDEKTTLIDELISKKQSKIELLKEQRKALINHAVTKGLNAEVALKDSKIEWIGDIPEHWKFVKVGHYTIIIRGASPRPAGDPSLFDGDFIHWITVKEVTNGLGKFVTSTDTYLTEEGMKQSRIIEPETLVISNSGATLGVPKILKIRGCINDGSVAFPKISEKLFRDFLYYFFTSQTELLREQQSGYGQPNLNTDLIANIRFPLPPLSEQQAIVAYLDEQTALIDKNIELESQKITTLKEYRQSLISAVVTGKICVIDN